MWFARRRSVLSNTPLNAAAAAALQQHLCNVRYNVIACTALRFRETLTLGYRRVLKYYAISVCSAWSPIERSTLFKGFTCLSVFFAYVILSKWYGASLGYAMLGLKSKTTGHCCPLVS